MEHSFSAGAVVIGPGNLVVVVNQHGNSWSLPKGHINPGEDTKTAAAREIYEESGISRLEFIEELGTYERHRMAKIPWDDAAQMKTITIFLCTTEQQELKPKDPDNPEARWVEPDKVAELLTHHKDKKFFRSVLPKVKEFIKNSPALS